VSVVATIWSTSSGGNVFVNTPTDTRSAGLRPIAVDLPGLGCSDGELDIETAAVPVL
jgi:hypothetical protein